MPRTAVGNCWGPKRPERRRCDVRLLALAFLNCNADHHSVALGDADNDALNHIAFLMPDLESVMRGGGRMKDAGHAIEWGPGRHGPGDNAFNYFIDPVGVVIEYTAEVEQIDDSYRARTPDRLEVAARPRRPVGHLAATQRAPERSAARHPLRPGGDRFEARHVPIAEPAGHQRRAVAAGCAVM